MFLSFYQIDNLEALEIIYCGKSIFHPKINKNTNFTFMSFQTCDFFRSSFIEHLHLCI